MIDLAQHLQRFDAGYWRIVAELWGVGTSNTEGDIRFPESAQQLARSLLDPPLVREVVAALPKPAQQALQDLLQNQGCLPWSLFTRRYGIVREMGPARRDREQPYRNPASPAEVLWYRALIARAFLDTPAGPQEFACIPSDLAGLLPFTSPRPQPPPGWQATSKECAVPQPATDRILDHATSMLAALRMGLPFDSPEFTLGAWSPDSPGAPSIAALRALLLTAGLLDPQTNQPVPEATRRFLEATRGEALAQLAQSWIASPTFNELRLLPGVRAEGEWQNDPLRARQAILRFLSQLPEGVWWHLESFVQAIKQIQPDFQRPAGDYDSWYLYDAASGAFLRGFEHWDRVDGALIRYLITGPLHWLGILDLASPAPGKPHTAFRFSGWAASLLRGASAESLPLEEETIRIGSDARLRLPRLTPRAVRYQIARFCEWEPATGEAYHYRLTHTSLQRARQQGLKVNHLIALLQRHAPTVPPSLIKALERWEKFGSEARLEQLLVLRLRTPEMLQEIRSSRAARFLGAILGPTAVAVKPGAERKLLAILAEMGYLAESSLSEKAADKNNSPEYPV